MEMVSLYHLVGLRRDGQERLTCRHLQHPRRWYCLLDPDATYADLACGDATLYRKCKGPESEPAYPVDLSYED